MIRKLKAMGLALVAVFAMSAVVASAAQAFTFHSEAEHTLLNASQSTTHEFTAGSGFGAISCETATFAGTAASASAATQTITPTYGNCKDSLGRTADVNTNECTYTFEVTGEAGGVFSGNTDIACPGSPIEIKVTNTSKEVKCTITVAAQENVGPVKFENVANGDVKVISEANNVKNTTSGGLLNCGVSNGTHTAGTYTGDAITAGTNTEGGGVNINVE
jgi:hypothetical protein